MRKLLLLSLVISFSFAACSPSHETLAMGPSSSGGGNTNPTRAKPRAVFDAIDEGGAQALLAWLHAAENEYRLMHRDPQNRYAKLFGGTKTIYDVLAVTPVELRYSEPCYDDDGVTHDGSIYAHTKGAICISAFSLAQRLDEGSVKQETLALVVHEMSHLVGTTEEEARAIQNTMLVDFSHINIDDLVAKPFEAGTEVDLIADSIHDYIVGESGKFALESVYPYTAFQETYYHMRFEGYPRQEHFLMISPDTQDMIDAHLCIYENLDDYMCTVDPVLTDEDKKDCQREIDVRFLDAKEVTAQTFYSRSLCIGIPSNPEFSKITIRRIDSESDLIADLKLEEDFLTSLSAELESLSTSKIAIVKVP